MSECNLISQIKFSENHNLQMSQNIVINWNNKSEIFHFMEYSLFSVQSLSAYSHNCCLLLDQNFRVAILRKKIQIENP